MADDALGISIVKISLSRSQHVWVKRQVASGAYADGSAYICHLIAGDQGSQKSHLLRLENAAAEISAEANRRGFSDKQLEEITDDVSGQEQH